MRVLLAIGLLALSFLASSDINAMSVKGFVSYLSQEGLTYIDTPRAVAGAGSIVSISVAGGWTALGDISQCVADPTVLRKNTEASRRNAPAAAGVNFAPDILEKYLNVSALGPQFADVKRISVEPGELSEESVDGQGLRVWLLEHRASLAPGCVRALRALAGGNSTNVFVLTDLWKTTGARFQLVGADGHVIRMSAGNLASYVSFADTVHYQLTEDGRLQISDPIYLAFTDGLAAMGLTGPGAAPVNLLKGIEVERTTALFGDDSGCAGGGVAPLKFTAPIWNAWFEPRLAADVPAYKETELTPGSDYSLVLNLAAISYRCHSSGIWSVEASSQLRDWVSQNSAYDAADVDVVVIPDLNLFEPVAGSDETGSLRVDLKRIRTAHTKGFQLTDTALTTEQRLGKQTPFLFGETMFHLRTGARKGAGFVTLAIWVNRHPIDEVTLAVCVRDTGDPPCQEQPSGAAPSLAGIDLAHKGSKPDAALQLIDAWSELVGVFRCNSCSAPDDTYLTWQMPRTTADFSGRLKDLATHLSQRPDAASHVSPTKLIEMYGDDLFNLVFPSTVPKAQIAAQAFSQFLDGALKKPRDSAGKAPTLYVRLMPRMPELILTPVNLMRVPVSSGKTVFVGHTVNVEAALEREDYSAPNGCVSKWKLFVTPKNRPDITGREYKDVLDARAAFESSLTKLSTGCPDCLVQDEVQFHDWLRQDPQPVAAGQAVVTLSHHSANALYFYAEGSPSVGSAGLRRHFAAPAIAILDGCGTGEIGASDFVRGFNMLGVDAVIATSTDVDAAMAGKFLTLLFKQLENHKGDATYGIADARFDTVAELAKAVDDSEVAYGSRALVFMFAGNGAIRACPIN